MAALPKRIEATDWTPEKVEKLWDWYANYPHLQHLYFSNRVGDGISQFLHAAGVLKGRVLDYGCGVGYLLEHLITSNIQVYGADLSPVSVKVANEKFASHKNWHGAVQIDDTNTPYDDNSFDLVTCVETIEHLSDELVVSLLREIKRILRPTGTVVITTPCDEKLEQSLSYCPFCDSEFHKWQHMRSFSENTLQNVLDENGFTTTFCRGLHFGSFQKTYQLAPLKELNVNRLYDWSCFQLRVLYDRLFPSAFPNGRDCSYRLQSAPGIHLVAIATKQP